MTPEEIISLATLITSLGAVIIGWRNSSRIQDVHLQINSRMDQLLKVTETAAKAAGVTSERLRAETERQEESQ